MSNKGWFKKGHKRFGTGMLGRKHTKETKDKISQKKTEKPTNYWFTKIYPWNIN